MLAMTHSKQHVSDWYTCILLNSYYEFNRIHVYQSAEYGICIPDQFAFFDFYLGSIHQIVARVRVEAVKVTPRVLIVQVEVLKVAK